MKQNDLLSVTSILSVLLLALHISQDIVFGLDRAGLNHLVGVAILLAAGYVRLCVVLGKPDPCDFGIGVCDRRNHACVEMRLLSRCRLGGDVRLVHRLVRKHGLSDDVPDGVLAYGNPARVVRQIRESDWDI